MPFIDKCFYLIMTFTFASASFGGEQSSGVEDLLARIEVLYLHENADIKAKLTVDRPEGRREYDLEILSMGRNSSFVKVSSSGEEDGKAYLKSGKNLWWYHPRELRERQVSRTGSLRRFLKSEFSRDDLLHLNRLAEEYDTNLIDQGSYLKLVLTPKMITTIVWDRIVFEIDPDTYLPISKTYYDEQGGVSKKLVYSAPQEFDGYLVPTILEMTNYKYKGYSSRLELTDIAFDRELDPRTFTINYLISGQNSDY